MQVLVVVSNYLQEVDIMSTHFFAHIANEKYQDIAHSIEVFAGMIAVAAFVALVCFAAV
jgi:hypothetical protein